MATVINNPAIPPAGTSNPYGTLVNNPATVVPSGGGDPVATASLWAASAIQQPYDFYEVRTFRDRDTGVRKMPVAGPRIGTAAEIIQVCAPFGRKVVAYATRRTLVKPQLPVVEPDSANQILRYESHEERALELAADGGTFVYTCWGVYVYEYAIPLSPSTGQPLSFGQPPTFDGSTGSHQITPSDFIPGITTGD